MASSAPQETRIELLGTVQVWHDHLTASLCQTVFQQTRTTERARHWTLHALAEFWPAVILRAPHSLPQALEEATAGTGAGWPAVQATPEACFERCRDLRWQVFAKLYEAFVAHVLPEALPCYAQPRHPLRDRFAEVWVGAGSRLDAVAHRRKVLRHVRAPVLPGCVTAFDALYRGITRHLAFHPDAAAGELPRATAALEQVPQGPLLVGDRLSGVGAFFATLTARRIAGLCRRNRRQSWRWVCALSKPSIAGGTAGDRVVESKDNQAIPPQTLRWLYGRKSGERRELLTNVLEPKQLSVSEALSLYHWRWKVERLFFDLKVVLNLHRFYTTSPNAGAMQVYAAALVHTAFRVAQGHIAQASGIAPEAISPAKFFPRLAAASIGLTWSEVAFMEIQQANPGVALHKPDWRCCDFAWPPWQRIQVEPRKGRRRKRRFCQSRKQWKSFAHIPGGKKLT
jgi:hypothetical protein